MRRPKFDPLGAGFKKGLGLGRHLIGRTGKGKAGQQIIGDQATGLRKVVLLRGAT